MHPGHRSPSNPVVGVAVRIYGIGMRTYEQWRADRTIRLGAGLAYYALFTIVPFYTLSVVLIERLFDRADMESYVAARIESLAIADSDEVAEAIVDAISARSVQTSLGLIGLGALLFAASLLFLALVDAINTIWDVPVGSGLRYSIQRRLVAFVMVLATLAVLAAELAVTAISGAASAIVPGETPVLGELLAHVSSGLALAGALILLNRYAGPVRVPWLSAVIGGVATTAALVIGTWAFSLYLETFGGASVSGAFSALLALLTWVYVEAQILLAGVQLTKTLATELRTPSVGER